MPEYVATTIGLFPLPDWAKDTLSDLKGHQKHDLIAGDEPDEVVAEYAAARSDVIETQIDTGLDRVVEGQLRWDDMLAHPLAVHDAVDTRGIVRYFDNNNFYRDPVVTGPLTESGDVAAELDSAAGLTDSAIQAVLPGPYTLAELATDEHYGDESAFLTAIAEFLAGEMGAFPPTDSLFLLEPSLVTDPPAPERLEAVGEAIDTVATAAAGDVVVQGYWGAYDERTHATLLEAAIDAVGYDLVTAAEANASLVAEQGSHDRVALGVVDGQNTLIETTDQIRDRIDRFEAQLPGTPETVYVTPNTELYYLPVPKFEAKLEVLGDAVAPEVAV